MLQSVAAAKAVTVAPIAIAWVAAQGSDIVPLIGARKRRQFSQSLSTQKLEVSRKDLELIEKAIERTR